MAADDPDTSPGQVLLDTPKNPPDPSDHFLRNLTGTPPSLPIFPISVAPMFESYSTSMGGLPSVPHVSDNNNFNPGPQTACAGQNIIPPRPWPFFFGDPEEHQSQADSSHPVSDSNNTELSIPSTHIRGVRRSRRQKVANPGSTARSATTAKLRTRVHTRNDAHKSLAPATKKKRDRHVTCIQGNWRHKIQRWMPDGFTPTWFVAVKGGRTERQAVKYLKDFRTPLLEALSRLSVATKGKQTRAREYLQKALRQRVGADEQSELTPADVQLAFEMYQQDHTSASSVGPTTVQLNEVAGEWDKPDDTDGIIYGARAHVAPAKVDTEAPTYGDARARGFADDGRAIKQEVGASWTAPALEQEMETLREARARRDLAQAELEEISQRRRVRGLMRQCGTESDNAIVL